MKTLTTALLGALCLAAIACNGQNLSADKVPAAVKTAFASKFDAATPKWELEDNLYEAEFKLGKVEMTACFTATGAWMETETEIKTDALPAAVTATIKRDFASYKIEDAMKIEHADGTTTYEAELEKGEVNMEVILDPNGKVLKQQEVKEDED
jgi:Putative beta-lactamase-inhibitor-like, PepSY-like